MNCSIKTIFKWSFGLLAALTIAFVTLPQFRVWILASGPTLLLLLCPLHMVYCMVTRNGKENGSPVDDTMSELNALNTSSVGTVQANRLPGPP